jgi:hypothetical protein
MAGNLRSSAVYSYQQLGDDDTANAIIDKWKIRYETLFKAGRDDIDGLAAMIAFAENDIDKTVKFYKLRQNKQDDYIINPNVSHDPM